MENLLTQQLPGIASQNSLSYMSGGNSITDVLANFGLITLYPTGGSWDIPNVGAVSKTYTSNNVRVVITAADGSSFAYLGYITYLTPGQINLWCVAQGLFNGQNVLLSGNVGVRVEKNVSGAWTPVSSVQSTYFERGVPHMGVIYQSGEPKVNAVLYAYSAGSYGYYKTVLDGNPNPRVVNGQPTVLAIYVTGAAPPPPDFNICETTLKLGGSLANGQLLSSYVASGFDGVQQVNVLVPSNMSATTDIELGIRTKYVFVCDSVVHWGNQYVSGPKARIPNWV